MTAKIKGKFIYFFSVVWPETFIANKGHIRFDR